MLSRGHSIPMGSSPISAPRPVPGPTGPQGPTGVAGTTINVGTGAPSDATGNSGDMYLNKTDGTWYGPKATLTWSGTGPIP